MWIPSGASDTFPSGQFPSAPCVSQQALAGHLAHLTITLGLRVPRPPGTCDFPRTDSCLHRNGDRPILVHSACSPTPTQHSGSCLSGCPEFESHKRDCPTATCPAPKPTQRMQARGSVCPMAVLFLAGLSVRPTHFPTTLWAPVGKSQVAALT